MNKRNRSASDRPAALALIAVIIIFLAVVGRGWQGLFAAYGLTASIIVGLLIAIIGAVLAYAIGAERAFQNSFNTTALAYFFFLFNISALGTVNAAFVTFQAGNIFREEIERASEATIKLRDIGQEILSSPEYTEYEKEVDKRWRDLKREIENPLKCGQGEEAVRRANELQAILPSFRLLAAGSQCSNIPLLVESYEKQVSDLLVKSPKYTKEKDKIEFGKRLTAETEKMLADLKVASKSLNSSINMQEIKGRLFDNSEKYTLLRQELITKSKNKVDGIPGKIDVSTVSALGDIGQVLPFIIGRMSEPSTYVYLTVAVFLDLAVVAAFLRILRPSATSQQKKMANRIRQI